MLASHSGFSNTSCFRLCLNVCLINDRDNRFIIFKKVRSQVFDFWWLRLLVESRSRESRVVEFTVQVQLM